MVSVCVSVCVLSVTRLRAVAALNMWYCSNMSLKMQRLRSQGRFHRYLAVLLPQPRSPPGRVSLPADSRPRSIKPFSETGGASIRLVLFNLSLLEYLPV